jgi:hypothetical protein
MFRKTLLAVLIIAGGGLMATAGGGTAVAQASACPTPGVIEITSFAFNPSAVTPGGSSTATLTAQNCTAQTVQASETWSGQFAGPSTGTPGSPPPGCPVIDPVALAVTFPPNGSVTSSVGYSVPSSCTATQLIVTVDIYGTNGVLYAHGTATLEIVQITPASARMRT